MIDVVNSLSTLGFKLCSNTCCNIAPNRTITKSLFKLAIDQEVAYPGERDRKQIVRLLSSSKGLRMKRSVGILYGLQRTEPRRVVDILLQRLNQDVDALGLLVKLFPVSEFLPKQEVPCFRCGHQYDPNHASQCVRAHPESQVELLDSTNSSQYCFRCSRCDKTWFAKEGNYFETVDATTPACFTGAHASSKEEIVREGWS